MSAALIITHALAPGHVIARDLETDDRLALDPAAPVHLDGVGELARAGQCCPGERGWTAMGRPVVIVRRVLRGAA